MYKRRDISKDKLASGLLRGAVVSGLAAGLVAASLGGVPTANGTCIGLSGININLGDGGGCFSTLGSFSLGIGPNTIATAIGFLNGAVAIGLGNEPLEITQAASFGFFNFAWAGGPDTFAETNGNANLAVVQGENARTVVGSGTAFDNINLAFNFGNGFDTGVGFTLDRETNTVGTIGQGNIAANIFGNSIAGATLADRTTWSVVRAGGITATPLTVGFANASYNLFGNGNQVTAGDQASLFSLAFSAFGDRNDVVVNGPLAAGGALFQSDQSVSQTGPGIEINEAATGPGSTTNVLATGGTQANGVRLNPTTSNTNVLAASGTQANRVRLNPTGSNTNGLAASGTQKNRVRLNDTGSNTNGLAASGTHKNRVRLNPTGINTTGISTVGPTGTNTVGGSGTHTVGSSGTNTTGTGK